MQEYKRIGRLLLFLLPVMITGTECFPQVLSYQPGTEENIYLARTKQFNEFLDRFNYLTDFRGNHVDSAYMAKMPREKALNYLFDLEDLRILQGNPAYSPEFIGLKSHFISEVVTKGLRIYKYSGNIIAEAKSRILFNGRPHTISVFLSQEIVGDDMVKWVILDVKGEILNFNRTDTASIRFISPGSNETDFINLKRALKDTEYLPSYASENYKADLLSAFFFGIQTGLIKFEYVEEVIYHILDIPGWCIRVKEFNRNEMNSGWLITDLSDENQGVDNYIKGL